MHSFSRIVQIEGTKNHKGRWNHRSAICGTTVIYSEPSIRASEGGTYGFAGRRAEDCRHLARLRCQARRHTRGHAYWTCLEATWNRSTKGGLRRGTTKLGNSDPFSQPASVASLFDRLRSRDLQSAESSLRDLSSK
jgi:hypothetical protein